MFCKWELKKKSAYTPIYLKKGERENKFKSSYHYYRTNLILSLPYPAKQDPILLFCLHLTHCRPHPIIKDLRAQHLESKH